MGPRFDNQTLVRLGYDDISSEGIGGFALNVAGKYQFGNDDDIENSIPTGTFARYIALDAA